mmetsp:Transcript_8680/g.28546  ORF Transcript_8680/g.28546 Transcript_8680/m.28546 type:complete len:290 (+) Transcript_8680:499-1368(+)
MPRSMKPRAGQHLPARAASSHWLPGAGGLGGYLRDPCVVLRVDGVLPLLLVVDVGAEDVHGAVLAHARGPVDGCPLVVLVLEQHIGTEVHELLANLGVALLRRDHEGRAPKAVVLIDMEATLLHNRPQSFEVPDLGRVVGVGRVAVVPLAVVNRVVRGGRMLVDLILQRGRVREGCAAVHLVGLEPPNLGEVAGSPLPGLRLLELGSALVDIVHHVRVRHGVYLFETVCYCWILGCPPGGFLLAWRVGELGSKNSKGELERGVSVSVKVSLAIYATSFCMRVSDPRLCS